MDACVFSEHVLPADTHVVLLAHVSLTSSQVSLKGDRLEGGIGEGWELQKLSIRC